MIYGEKSSFTPLRQMCFPVCVVCIIEVGIYQFLTLSLAGMRSQTCTTEGYDHLFLIIASDSSVLQVFLGIGNLMAELG